MCDSNRQPEGYNQPIFNSQNPSAEIYDAYHTNTEMYQNNSDIQENAETINTTQTTATTDSQTEDILQ